MSFNDDIKRVVDDEIALESGPVFDVSNQVQITNLSGMAVIQQIVESASSQTGKYCVCLMVDGQTKVNARPGPSSIQIGQSVTIVGGRILS